MSMAIIFDTETTGKINPIIVEAAWIKVENLNPFKTSEVFSQRFNPGKKIELGALATHHILDEDLIHEPPASEFQLPQFTSYIIGHNIDYDWSVIGNPDIKRICTYALAKFLWPELDSHSQSSIIYFLDRLNAKQKLQNSHSALKDVENCAFILEVICKELSISSIDALWEKSEIARVPTHINFGKYKGMALADIPSDYKSWLLKQDDIDTYLKKALNKH